LPRAATADKLDLLAVIGTTKDVRPDHPGIAQLAAVTGHDQRARCE
jgi:hypothetical protein